MPGKKVDNKYARITRNVIALGLVSLFTDAATEMIYPLVPLFVTLLGSGVLVLGVIEGIAETTASMLKLVSGILSDKSGRRKLLVVVGYGISTLIRPLTGAVSAAWQIVFVRMIDRVGKGIRTAPRDALIAASIDNRIRGKAYGFHRAMDHTGAVIGPLLAIAALAILILIFNIPDITQVLRWIFLLTIIPGIFALATLIFFVKEKASLSERPKIKFSLKQFDKNYRIYLSVIILFTLGNSSDAFLLFRIQETFHQSDSVYSLIFNTPLVAEMMKMLVDMNARKVLADIIFLSLIWAFFHMIKVLFSTRFGALSDKIGRKIVINMGWAVYVLVYIAFALLDQLPDVFQIIVTFVLIAVYALYYAFSEGAEKAFVADLISHELHGSAFGLYNFAVGLAALPASIIFGFLYSTFGAASAFGMGAMLALVSMLLFMIFVKEKRV